LPAATTAAAIAKQLLLTTQGQRAALPLILLAEGATPAYAVVCVSVTGANGHNGWPVAGAGRDRYLRGKIGPPLHDCLSAQEKASFEGEENS
jgi:hypothetical protein